MGPTSDYETRVTSGRTGKKTSIYLVHTAGFAGIHPRKGYPYLNLRTNQPILSARFARSERIFANRSHDEVKLTSPDEVDGELPGWMRAAYALG